MCGGAHNKEAFIILLCDGVSGMTQRHDAEAHPAEARIF